MLTALDSKVEKMHQRLVALDEHVSVSKRDWETSWGVRTIFYISIQHAGMFTFIHPLPGRYVHVAAAQHAVRVSEQNPLGDGQKLHPGTGSPRWCFRPQRRI